MTPISIALCTNASFSRTQRDNCFALRRHSNPDIIFFSHNQVCLLRKHVMRQILVDTVTCPCLTFPAYFDITLVFACMEIRKSRVSDTIDFRQFVCLPSPLSLCYVDSSTFTIKNCWSLTLTGDNRKFEFWSIWEDFKLTLAFHQIRKFAGCACAGNTGNWPVAGETFPAFPVQAQLPILRIW